jgi:hypothetical protein
MAASERDFSTVIPGDDVYELAGGVIPELADKLEVPIGETPSLEDLQAIATQLGKNKVMRNNDQVQQVSRLAMANLVDTSGIQNALNRALWTPDISTPVFEVRRIIMLGGVANWQDRTVDIILGTEVPFEIHALGGNRVMDTETEKENPNIKLMFEELGRYPTEAEYIKDIVTAEIEINSYSTVLPGAYDSDAATPILTEFFNNNPQVLDEKLAVARVANTGLLMAIQVRNAARKINPNFDNDPADPQLFVLTDTVPPARSDEEAADALHFQNPQNALRQVVLTAKKLHEAYN